MKKFFLAALAVSLMIFSAGCGKSGVLKIGTGNKGGNYYAYGEALSRLDSSISVRNTAGSQANMRLIDDGYIDFAIVQSDVLSDAVNGKGDFENSPVSGVRAVAGLYNEAFQVIVRADSGIHELSDLEGRTMSVGDEGSGAESNAERLLLSAGVNSESVRTVNMSYSESADAIRNGSIDAFFAVLGAPSQVINELYTDTDINILSVSDQSVAYMMNIFEGYTGLTIPAGTYNGQNEDINTVGVKAVLCADSRVKEEDVIRTAGLIFDGRDEIGKKVSVQLSDPKEAVRDIPCIFHSGAEKYYSSAGLETDSPAEYNR